VRAQIDKAELSARLDMHQGRRRPILLPENIGRSLMSSLMSYMDRRPKLFLTVAIVFGSLPLILMAMAVMEK
jgi:hypothetical protein